MKSFFIIFSVQLRARFGLSALKSDFANNRAKFIKNALLGLLVLFSFATLIGMWGWLVYSLTIGLSQLGMQELSLLLPFMASMLLVLVFGIAGIFGQLFQAKDIELLASLPVGQGAVFASKFFLVYLYELGASLLFVLPAIFAYMLAAGGGAPLIIKGIIAALTVPVIPLAISAFISIILMRFSGFARHRELFMVVAGIALTAAFIGIQQWISFQLGNMSQSEIFAILEQNSGLISLAGRSFPPALWLTNAVALSGMDSLIGWALYLLCSAAVFAAACAVLTVCFVVLTASFPEFCAVFTPF